MESGGGKLHIHFFREFVKFQHVGRIVVRHGATEADVFHAHLFQFFQNAQPFSEAAFSAAQFVVLFGKSFHRNSDADVGEFFCQCYHAVFKPPRGGNHDAGRLCETNSHKFFQILTDKRFATSEIDKFQLGQTFEILWLNLFFWVSGVVPYIAHLAMHGATVS